MISEKLRNSLRENQFQSYSQNMSTEQKQQLWSKIVELEQVAFDHAQNNLHLYRTSMRDFVTKMTRNFNLPEEAWRNQIPGDSRKSLIYTIGALVYLETNDRTEAAIIEKYERAALQFAENSQEYFDLMNKRISTLAVQFNLRPKEVEELYERLTAMDEKLHATIPSMQTADSNPPINPITASQSSKRTFFGNHPQEPQVPISDPDQLIEALSQLSLLSESSQTSPPARESLPPMPGSEEIMDVDDAVEKHEAKHPKTSGLH